MIKRTSFLKKYSSLIILFTLVVCIGGIIWLVIIPVKQTLLERAQGIQEFYAEEENQVKQVNRLPELKDQYTLVKENESVLNILLNENQIVDFIKTLERLAGETNIQMTITSKDNGQIFEQKKVPVKTVSTGTKNDESAADTVNTKLKTGASIEDSALFSRYLRLNIKASGQYKDIVSFLRKIETLPVALDVIGMEMKKVDIATQKKILESNVPFSFSSGDSNIPQSAPQEVVPGLLEGAFDVLVYVNK